MEALGGSHKVEEAVGGEGRTWVNHHLGHTEYTGSVHTLYTLYTGTSYTEYTGSVHTLYTLYKGTVCIILTAGQYIKPVLKT